MRTFTVTQCLYRDGNTPTWICALKENNDRLFVTSQQISEAPMLAGGQEKMDNAPHTLNLGGPARQFLWSTDKDEVHVWSGVGRARLDLETDVRFHREFRRRLTATRQTLSFRSCFRVMTIERAQIHSIEARNSCGGTVSSLQLRSVSHKTYQIIRAVNSWNILQAVDTAPSPWPDLEDDKEWARLVASELRTVLRIATAPCELP
jgi:hypothetical protein